MASADWVVSFSGTQRGYGNIVIVDHGGAYQTAYAHLDSRGVRAGQNVRRGQTLGRLGQSGNATAPHVHYEVRRRGAPINPAPYLP